MVDLFNSIEAIINQIISPLNWVMLFLIIGGGIYLTIISKANPLMRIVSGFKLMLRKDPSNIGISRFQALSAVLAATVGLGKYFRSFYCYQSRRSRCFSMDVGYCFNWSINKVFFSVTCS